MYDLIAFKNNLNYIHISKLQIHRIIKIFKLALWASILFFDYSIINRQNIDRIMVY